MKRISLAVLPTLLMVSLTVHAAEPRALTGTAAGEDFLSISHDGAMLTWLADREGTYDDDVWLFELATGKAVNLTASLPEAPGSGRDFMPQFSPDNKAVFFLGGTELWWAPVDGRAPEQLTQDQDVQGFLVVPEKNVVLFSSQRPLDRRDFKKGWPKGAAGIIMTKLYSFDIKTRKVTLFTHDIVSDEPRVRRMADGRFVILSGYDDQGSGDYSDRAIGVIDAKGNRERIGLAAPFSFEPVYLQGGNLLIVKDQVLEGENFVYPLVTWDLKGKKAGKLSLPVPPGQEVGATWSVPGYKSLLLTFGSEATGYGLVRYDEQTGAVTRLADKRFKEAWGGAVTADGKRLYFLGTLPEGKGADVFVVDLP